VFRSSLTLFGAVEITVPTFYLIARDNTLLAGLQTNIYFSFPRAFCAI